MSQPLFGKSDLIKRINYQTIFQEIVHALPAIMLERANHLTDAEVKVITDLRGNVIAMAVAICHSIKMLYKAIPEYTEMRNLSPASYSDFLHKALQGLITIDERLLKPPLQRLFGDSILIDEAINTQHSMFVYLKLCGSDFIAQSKRPMTAHFADALKDSFLSFQPYRRKAKASYAQRQLTYFPILKPPGKEPETKDKWQLYWLSESYHAVKLPCTAEKSDDRFKVYYEDVHAWLNDAMEQTKTMRAQLKFRVRRDRNLPEPKTSSLELTQQIHRQFAFKNVEIKNVNPAHVYRYLGAFEHIADVLGPLAEIVNRHTKLVFTHLRTSSVYDRKAKMLVLSIDERYHECKLGYLYGQAIDSLIASLILKKPNHLASDYWFLIDEPESPEAQAIINLFRSMQFQRSPQFVYAAAILDALHGKQFFLHPAEIFARAIMKVLSMGTSSEELQIPKKGIAGLLYPSDAEADVYLLAIEGMIASMNHSEQSQLALDT
jgi:hypothetical protein